MKGFYLERSLTQVGRNELFLIFAVIASCVLLLTVLIERKLIPVLRKKKMGQKILDIGPKWHIEHKEGTPTMGGLAFIIASSVIFILFFIFALIKDKLDEPMILLSSFAYALLNAGIGIIDDYAKLTKKQNQGLTAIEKIVLQFIASALFITAIAFIRNGSTVLYIPFFDYEFEMGIFYYAFAAVLMTGIVNSVNLTDGLDGLASSVTLFVGIFFASAGFAFESTNEVVMAALVIGSVIGFLFFNFHPAKVFMGDTGSLFLGGAVVGMAFIIDNPLIIVVCGIIYIIEALSDIIQVGVFKLTKKLTGEGKRVFKMAPFHHHLEMCKWSENKIVFAFSLVTIIFSAIAYFGLGI